MKDEKIWALIPAFNAESAIGEVIRQTQEHLPISRIIIINDGSTDGTADVARSYGVEVLSLPDNRGKGFALRLGFAHVLKNGCNAIITLDADGQHDPSDIPKFFQAHGADSGAILVGSRMAEAEKFPRQRYYSNQVAVFFISKALGHYLEDTQCGFRLYPAEVFRPIDLRTSRFQMETEIVLLAAHRGVRLRSVPIKNIYWNGNDGNGHPPRSNFRPVIDTFHICMVVLESYLGIL